MQILLQLSLLSVYPAAGTLTY